MFGTSSSDTIQGTSGNDIISGVPASGTNPGRGTVDVLTGNGGDDIFVLGDSNGRFYDDGRATNSGFGDYANITDFSDGDRVQVAAGRYFLSAHTTGMRIFFDSNNSSRLDSGDEMIGLVQGSKTITLADLVHVAASTAGMDVGAGDIDVASAFMAVDSAPAFFAVEFGHLNIAADIHQSNIVFG